MKTANEKIIREDFTKKLFELMKDSEDCGMIKSNSFNFPVVAPDGEEGWVEIVIKVPHDDGDEGYLKRQEFEINEQKKRDREAKKEAEALRREEKANGSTK